jgi:hypothetical protein
LQKLHEADDKKSTIIVSPRGETRNIRTAMNRGGIRFTRAAVRSEAERFMARCPLLLAAGCQPASLVETTAGSIERVAQ